MPRVCSGGLASSDPLRQLTDDIAVCIEKLQMRVAAHIDVEDEPVIALRILQVEARGGVGVT